MSVKATFHFDGGGADYADLDVLPREGDEVKVGWRHGRVRRISHYIDHSTVPSGYHVNVEYSTTTHRVDIWVDPR